MDLLRGKCFSNTFNPHLACIHLLNAHPIMPCYPSTSTNSRASRNFPETFQTIQKIIGPSNKNKCENTFLSLSWKSFEGILPFGIGDWLCNHHDEDPSHLKASVYLDPAYLSPYLSRHISPPTEYLSDNSQVMHRMCFGAHTNIQCIANKENVKQNIHQNWEI